MCGRTRFKRLSGLSRTSFFEAFRLRAPTTHAVLGKKKVYICMYCLQVLHLQVFVFQKVGVALSPTLCMCSTCKDWNGDPPPFPPPILFPRLNHDHGLSTNHCAGAQGSGWRKTRYRKNMCSSRRCAVNLKQQWCLPLMDQY